MRSFKDCNGASWDISISTKSAKRVRDALGFDVTKLYSPEVATQLRDFELLVNVVYLLVRPQCELRGISDEAFGEAMVGDSLSSAVDALWGAVEDFFPKENRLLMSKIKQTGEIIQTASLETIAAIDPKEVAMMHLSRLQT